MNGTIILLEDAATHREIVGKMLQNLGFRVLMGANGEEGFKLVEQCELASVPLSAIISDMRMPIMDGPSFVRQLRENQKYENLLVIFMTSATDKTSLLQAKELNASYILKPVSATQLTAQLRSIT